MNMTPQEKLDKLVEDRENICNEIKKLREKAGRLKDRIISLEEKLYVTSIDIVTETQNVEDMKFPRLNGAFRIVGMDKKYVSIKRDGSPRTATTRYRVSDGVEFGKQFSPTIDAKKAVKIWDDWNTNGRPVCE